MNLPDAAATGKAVDRDGVERSATPPGFPVGVAAFVGRERERAQVADLFAHARVVTLCSRMPVW